MKVMTCNTIDNNLKMSRLVAYVDKNLNYSIREEHMTDDTSTILLEIKGRGRKKMLCGLCYQEHMYIGQSDKISRSDACQTRRWISVVDNWSQCIDSGMDTIMLGDVNIDYNTWETSVELSGQLVKEVEDYIISKGVYQCANKSTRCSKGVQNLIVHIWSTCLTMHTIPVVQQRAESDHDLSMIDYYGVEAAVKCQTVTKRSMKNFQPESFKEALRQTKWENVHKAPNISVAVHNLTENITTILEQMAPMKTIQQRSKYAPWLSEETKEMMDKRNELRRKTEETNCDNDWKIFKLLRRKCVRQLKSDKVKWEKKKLDTLEGER